MSPRRANLLSAAMLAVLLTISPSAGQETPTSGDAERPAEGSLPPLGGQDTRDPLSVASPEELFARGNTAYERGDFDEASRAYRAILDRQVRDPRVEYNLGNSEFKRGRLGMAILHYQRAKRLDPTDVDIQANLDYASSLTIDQVPEAQVAGVIRWIQGLQNRIGPDRQAWVAVLLVWVTAGLVAWGLARPARWSPAYGWSAAALLLAVAVTAASWYVTHERLAGRELAVVLDPAVEVLAGPGLNNPTLFTVHEGLTVEVRSEERSEWVQVSLPNGLSGWLPAETVGIV